MASYGWTVGQVDELPFVTAMALMEQVRKYPPPSVLQVDMMEQAGKEAEATHAREQEQALSKMGAVVQTKSKLLGLVVKRTGKKLV
jgi:hypothetical protein